MIGITGYGLSAYSDWQNYSNAKGLTGTLKKPADLQLNNLGSASDEEDRGVTLELSDAGKAQAKAAVSVDGENAQSKATVHTEQEAKKAGLSEGEIKGLKESGQVECETCKNRKYQDGSDESNVSFKTAAHVSPEAAGAAVRAHEGEHVSNAYKKAAEDDGEVVQASVTIHTSVCPECGRSYVSGGVTHTQIRYNNDQYAQNAKSSDAANLVGSNLSLAG